MHITVRVTDRQEYLLHHYLGDCHYLPLNVSAADRATGYSLESAYATGHKLLEHPDIRRLVETDTAAMDERFLATLDPVHAAYLRGTWSGG